MDKSRDTNHLRDEQARLVYKKVELGNIIDINTLNQEIEQEWEFCELDDTSGDINPYRELMVNDAEKIETVLSQMDQWSILSNVINYIQYNKHPRNFHSLNISTVNKEKCRGKEDEKGMLELDFGDTPDKLKEEYLHCVQRYTVGNIMCYKIWWKFSTTYLGK